MQRLLRNFRTGEYFTHGQWTAEVKAAQVFTNTKDAIDLAIERGLQNVEVVLQFGPEPSRIYDYHMALEFSRARPERLGIEQEKTEETETSIAANDR